MEMPAGGNLFDPARQITDPSLVTVVITPPDCGMSVSPLSDQVYEVAQTLPSSVTHATGASYVSSFASCSLSYEVRNSGGGIYTGSILSVSASGDILVNKGIVETNSA